MSISVSIFLKARDLADYFNDPLRPIDPSTRKVFNHVLTSNTVLILIVTVTIFKNLLMANRQCLLTNWKYNCSVKCSGHDKEQQQTCITFIFWECFTKNMMINSNSTNRDKSRRKMLFNFKSVRFSCPECITKLNIS